MKTPSSKASSITFVLNTGTSIFMDPMSRARQTLSTMRSCPTSSGLLLRQSIRASTAGITKLIEIEGGTLVSKNKSFMDMLQGGVEVRWFDGEGDRNEIVRLVDFDNPERNEFHVVNQWTYIERGTNKRPDVIVFVNGLPLVLFELKSPARAEADNEDAYQQIQNYKRQVPTFFVYNAFCGRDHHC